MPKILVIDDEITIQENIKFVLELENHDVITASDGEEGIRIFHENMHTLDAVITDMKMPKANGMEVLREIKQSMPSMSVIVLTGHGDMENAISAMKAGAFEYLKKPINADSLTISVSNAVNAKKLRLENARMQDQLKDQNAYLQGLHDAAQKILMNMIPKNLPNVEGFQYAARYRSADIVGGDMYNVSDIGDSICFYVFDVISHGILASVISIILKSFIENMEYNYRQGMHTKSFSQMVSDLNIQLRVNTAQNIFASLFIGFIDKKTRKLSYISAGHLTQYLLHGGEIHPLASTGTVLGIFDDETYACVDLDLHRGDKIILFTDGITEARSGELMFGQDGLCDVLRMFMDKPVEQIISSVYNSAIYFSKGEPDDDMTLLGIEISQI